MVIRHISETHAYQSKALMCVADGEAVIQNYLLSEYLIIVLI
ncbi:MAG: hypothetical protein ACYCSW_11295 [bacterium]